MIFVFLLFCGVNVPLDALPGWMQAIASVLPLTHGIAGRAARSPTARRSATSRASS